MTAVLYDLSAYRGALDERRKAIAGPAAPPNGITSPTAEWT